MQADKKQECIDKLERIYNRTKDGDIATIADVLLEILEKEVETQEES